MLGVMLARRIRPSPPSADSLGKKGVPYELRTGAAVGTVTWPVDDTKAMSRRQIVVIL